VQPRAELDHAERLYFGTDAGKVIDPAINKNVEATPVLMKSP
jgi:hypothetical protein